MEHLGEAFGHAAAYLLHLLFAIAGKFAPAAFGVAHDIVHVAQYLLACRCEFVETVGMQHHEVGSVESAAIADVARTMATIVRNIERLFASGGWCELGGDAIGIHIVIA